jgi:Flp pilus assembly protein TadG
MLRHRPGQSLVEFAFIAVALVLTLAIAVDFARVFSAYIIVGNMARAGAQYGSFANQLGETTRAGAEQGMIAAAFDEQDQIFGVAPTVRAQIYEDSDGLCGARVQVDYDFRPLISIPPIPGSLQISRTSEMRGQILDLCQ